jgi:ribosomal-protein-alanine N-acetyltransferase
VEPTERGIDWILRLRRRIPPDVEIGLRQPPEYWGQGLATESATAVLQYGWQRFAFDRLVAVIHPENKASIRVAEKIGMAKEATFVHHGTRSCASPS